MPTTFLYKCSSPHCTLQLHIHMYPIESYRLVTGMWLKCLFLALLTQCLALEQNCTQVDRKTKNLTIQLQVSQTLEFDFSGYIPAVELALDFINSNSCVLPDYHISFTDIIDPQVSGKDFNALANYHTLCRHM